VKVYTAIQKRIYRALKSEFTKLYRLNRLYLTATTRYKIGDEWREVTPEDYRLGGGVEPIADPTMVTDMQRLGRAQVVMSMVSDDGVIDPKKAKIRVLEAAGCRPQVPRDTDEDCSSQCRPTRQPRDRPLRSPNSWTQHTFPSLVGSYCWPWGSRSIACGSTIR
jgi:hypothetical protein